MLLQNFTSIVKTDERDLLPGHLVSEEGVALVFVRENGKMFVQESTGAPNEVFAGLALSRPIPPAHATAVEEHVVVAGETVVLDHLPIPGQVHIKVGGEAMEIVTGGTVDAATKVSLDGAEVTFHADHAQKEAVIQYHYELSALEARALTGDAPVGGVPGNIQGRCGFIEIGQVGTNMFDASVDWSNDSVMHPSLGAGGRLTIGGNGTKLTNVIIAQAPTAENAVLVLSVKGH